ncbi:MAG: glycosyl hydrolase family 5 [Alphaproteobacteria bacterium]|nr:MAG: glycosyl hydrolase family 5 [Alphaproteobacteria bacterium]
MPLWAQDIDAEDEAQPSEEALPAEAVIDPNFLNDDFASYDDYKKVVVRILDKITADTRTFDLNIGKTVAYGSLRMRPMTCKKAPPIEEPESASFIQVWEKTPEAKDEWIFSGWMFASSPSLSSMEHPVYDVWVIDCKD